MRAPKLAGLLTAALGIGGVAAASLFFIGRGNERSKEFSTLDNTLSPISDISHEPATDLLSESTPVIDMESELVTETEPSPKVDENVEHKTELKIQKTSKATEESGPFYSDGSYDFETKTKTGNNVFISLDSEKLAKLDSLYNDYYGSTTVSLEVAQKKVDTIRDYSFNMSFFGDWCRGVHRGTAWILDYVLPEGNQKYPTTWFVATNAHVAKYLKVKDNPYDQVVPQRAVCSYSMAWEKEDVEKTKNSELDFSPDLWQSNMRDRNTQGVSIEDYKGSTEEKDLPQHMLHMAQGSKIFYFPYNYAGGKDISRRGYAMDFVILEITFSSERDAEAATRHFYTKYDKERGTKKDQAINFFGEKLSQAQTSEELLKEKPIFFSAGYGGNSYNKHKSVGTYDQGSQRAMTFAKGNLSVSHNGEILLGHEDCGYEDRMSGYVQTPWDERDGSKGFHRRGYCYRMEGDFLSSGSSGSLVIDQNNNAIGVKSRSSMLLDNTGNRFSWVEPFRNKRLNANNDIHGYDFLEGAPGQLSSYKSQIQKYFLNKGKQTALSRERNWEVPS